jgi:hypothetical protein
MQDKKKKRAKGVFMLTILGAHLGSEKMEEYPTTASVG